MKDKILHSIRNCNITESIIADTWKEIVEIESYTHDRNSVNTLCDHLEKWFKSIGMETRTHSFEKAGSLLIAESGEGSPSEGIILTGHMDTVFKLGTLSKNPFRIEDGKVYGPGVLDMKGGLNLIPYIVQVLRDVGFTKKIKVIIAGDEEHGHANSNCAELMAQEAKGYKCAFNMETGLVENQITVARKGRIPCTISTHGKSAHAGANFNDGISAIYEMAHILVKVNDLNNTFSNASFSAGIVNGGEIVNAVPDFAKAEIDIRYFDEEDESRIRTSIEDICATSTIKGAVAKVQYDIGFPSFMDTLNKNFFDIVKNISSALGFGLPEPTTLGGSSDASFLTKAGVPVLCSMGVRGEWNHTDREYALLGSAWERLLLIVASVLNIENKSL